MESTRSKGYASERLCISYLIKSGYTILKQNYYCPYGEIDIIASKDGDVIFVEVKSTSSDYIDPVFKINKTKKERLKKSALHYMTYSDNYSQMHFDLITVTNNKIMHYNDIIVFYN